MTEHSGRLELEMTGCFSTVLSVCKTCSLVLWHFYSSVRHGHQRTVSVYRNRRFIPVAVVCSTDKLDRIYLLCVEAVRHRHKAWLFN